MRPSNSVSSVVARVLRGGVCGPCISVSNSRVGFSRVPTIADHGLGDDQAGQGQALAIIKSIFCHTDDNVVTTSYGTSQTAKHEKLYRLFITYLWRYSGKWLCSNNFNLPLQSSVNSHKTAATLKPESVSNPNRMVGFQSRGTGVVPLFWSPGSKNQKGFQGVPSETLGAVCCWVAKLIMDRLWTYIYIYVYIYILTWQPCTSKPKMWLMTML